MRTPIIFPTRLILGLAHRVVVITAFVIACGLLWNWTYNNSSAAGTHEYEASLAMEQSSISDHPIYDLAVSHETGSALVMIGGKRVALLDLATGNVLGGLVPSDGHIGSATLSRDGHWFGLCQHGCPLELVSANDSTTRKIFADSRLSRVVCSAFSSNDRYFVTGSSDSEEGLRLWDTHSLVLVRVYDTDETPIDTVEFSPDGRHLIASCGDRRMRLYDIHEVRPIQFFQCEQPQLCGIKFLADRERIVSLALDGPLKIWDIKSGLLVAQHPCRSPTVLGLATSPDGDIVAYADTCGPIYLYSLQTEDVVGVLTNHTTGPVHLRFSQSGDQLYSASHDGSMRIWNLKTCREIRRVF